jgi:hypothetical protein
VFFEDGRLIRIVAFESIKHDDNDLCERNDHDLCCQSQLVESNMAEAVSCTIQSTKKMFLQTETNEEEGTFQLNWIKATLP